LPDGIFSNQKSKVWEIFEGLAVEDFGVFYVHFVYILYGHLVYYIHGYSVYLMVIWYFSPFWYVVARKIWQPRSTLPNEKNTNGAKGVHGFSEEPLSPILLELPVSGADVVSDGEAEHVVHGGGLGDVLACLTDDDGQFDLPIQLLKINVF
jgi:hypothetical protein